MTDGHVPQPDVSEIAGIAPRIVAHHPGADLTVTPLVPPQRRRKALPTLLPRLIILVGMSGLIGLLAKATIDALRSSRWEHPRPVLSEWMGRSAAALVFGCILWGVLAAINARRADLRGTPSPLLVPVVALLIVGSGVAIERLVTSHRTLTWEIWLGVSLLAYSYVVLTYRVTASLLGEIDSHFGTMALLPLVSGAISVWATYSEWLLFGLPMVGAMVLWLVAETQLAMFGWDRECRQRITGLDPNDKPIVQQYAEALQQASAMPYAGGDSPRDSYHHTLLPRAMVMAALALGMTLPFWVILLETKGHLSVAGVHTTIDDEAGRLLTGLVAVSLATYAVGWVWWAVAAALNARSHSHWSVSPWSAPAGYVASAAAAGATPVIVDHVDADIALVVVLAVGLLLAIAHFLVLRAYRSTAEGIGGPRRPWTLVIAIPWFALGFSIFAAFLAQALPDDPFERIMQGSWVVFYATFAVSLYLAMSSFDRACRGRSMHPVSRDALPEFLKRRRTGADTRP